MAQATLFKKYLSKCFDRLRQSLNGYERTPETELLFRFRVSIKKIRTCLACIEYYSGEADFKKSRKQFRKMFRTGGKLRELRLHHAWFRNSHLSRIPRLIQLPAQIKASEQLFLRNVAKMLEEISESRQLADARAARLSQEQVYRFYIYLLPTCLPILHGKLPMDKWHSTRKQLKRILYARHWQEGKALRILSKRQAVFLDQLQHQIGYWNDNKEMISWVKDQQKKYNKRGSTTSKKEDAQAFRRALELLNEKGIRYSERVHLKLQRGKTVLAAFSRRLNVLD